MLFIICFCIFTKWVCSLIGSKDINKLNYVNLFLIFPGDLEERYPFYSVIITRPFRERALVKRVVLTTRNP
jgi:hypothetical protein